MQIGYIGLGKMGLNMATRLVEKGYEIVGYNKTPEQTEKLIESGGKGAVTLNDMVNMLKETPRVVWLMVPHQAVPLVIENLIPLLSAGDIIIDGGNSFYKNTLDINKKLSDNSIEFVDAGISGGPNGAKNGASVMVGGKNSVVAHLEPLFLDIATKDGYAHVGPNGAGHFVKMVHNGIEYGMMQAIAEGFDILNNTPEFDLDLNKIMKPYKHGSVIESALINWLSDAYNKYGPDLENVNGTAGHLGEGEWTIKTAEQLGFEVEVIKEAFKARLDSQNNPDYQGKVISALRGEFGGHPVLKDDK